VRCQEWSEEGGKEDSSHHGAGDPKYRISPQGFPGGTGSAGDRVIARIDFRCLEGGGGRDRRGAGIHYFSEY
jgi:hypothetical protein